MRNKQSVFLSGFMGAGKTAVGRELAGRLGYTFIDLDKHIEQHEGMSVSQIFKKFGESRFRELESRYITGFLSGDSRVVALGGGTLQNESLKREILDKGILIFIDTPLEVIKKRLQRSKHRPLLYSSDGNRMQGGELDEFVENLYNSRKPVYESAHIRFVPTPGTAGDQADRIIQLLNNHD